MNAPQIKTAAPAAPTDVDNTPLVIEPKTALQVLTDDQEFKAFYDRVKAETDKHVPDVTTDKGRKAIAALAFKVTKTKTAIDAAGKALTEEARQQIATVDASRRKIRDQLDALRDEVRRPLTEWEEAEEQRVAECKRQMEALTAAAVVTLEDTAETVEARLLEVRGRNLNETLFGTEMDLAVQRRDHAVTTLTAALERLRQEEADRAELARLRAEREAAEAAEAERIRQEQEAAEARRREAEAAEAERQRQEREAEEARLAKERAEQERQEAEARAQRAADEAAERARREAEEAAEAERRRIAAEHEAQLTAERRRAEEAEAARQKEAERVERERREEEERQQRAKAVADARAADIAHRSSIMRAAKEALMEQCGLDEAAAKAVVLAISSNLIPHTAMDFSKPLETSPVADAA